jgi:serine/threonine protein kinase/WD40 repeat protein
MSVDANRVQTVFLAAVDADPAEQAGVLDRECGSDPELRRRVEALLRAHRDPASILERPAVTPPPAEPGPPAAAGPLSPPPGWAGASVPTADVPPVSDRDGPPQAGDRTRLEFLEPPTRPGALGRLGHYEVREVLGRGGFGVVLRAFDEMLQRVVAVKVLAPEVAATSPARKRFLREARSAAPIHHENVVQVYEIGEHPLPFIVMEFVPGETLQQMLDRTGPLDAAEVLRIGRQVAEGLAAAHANDLIHRDVKPGNVLIEGGSRRAKLTDFGLARAADDASLTQSGLVAGTPLYMAPEQAKGEAVDHRADLFSLGSVLYAMTAGRPPFRAGTTMAVLRRVCEDTPRPIREIIPEAPAWLCDLIGKLHAKDPAGRFQSAREVADLLHRYQAELEARGTVVPVALRPVRTNRWWGVPVAAVSLVLIGLLAYGLTRWWPAGSVESRNEPNPGPVPKAEPGPKPEPWRPRTPPTADELARMSSPFDALDRANLPRGATERMSGGADRAPPELVAVLDGSPARLPRPGPTTWFAEDRAGKWLAVGAGDEVVLFNRRTMAPAKVFGRASAPIYQMAFDPDGKRLATASRGPEGSAEVWDVERGVQTLRLKQKGECLSIQFSPDGARLLTVGEDHRPTVWDAGSGAELHQFPPQDEPVCYDVAFTPDGKHVVTHAAAGAVRVWDAKTWDDVVTRDGPERVTENLEDWRHLPLAVSPDGKWLAAGSDSGFKVWAIDGWKQQSAARTPATWLAFAPDGRTLLTAAHDCNDGRWHAVARWETQTGRPLPGGRLGSRGGWATYHLSSDGKTLYGMACDPAEPAVHVYDADTLEERVLPGHAGPVFAVDVSPDGGRIASAGADGTVRVWDVAALRLLHTIPRPGKPAVQAAFSPDGGTVYAGWSEDGMIFAIDPATGRRREVAAYGPRLHHLAVSPDGTVLAAAGEGGVRLWALPDGAPRGEVPGVPASPGPVAFSPDGRMLAVGGADSLRLFEVATGRSVGTLEFPGVVRWVGFRPDGASLAAAGEAPGHPVLVFDLAGGGRPVRLEGHGSPVLGGAWRADGGLLATAGATDGTARLWDFGHPVPKQRVVPVFEPNAAGIEAVAFAPEGRHLVTANPDGTIAVFRLAKAGEVFRVP